ncbi:MAG TPA: FecR domain-containing protein [Sphingobium sp.]|nr:FecR domain-containing protein [Sphingobium sp.]
MAIALLGLAAGAPALAQGGRPALEGPADHVRYTIRKGDTLYDLAERYFVRLEDYRAVQRLNHIADPYRIPIGRVITVPMRLVRIEPLAARLIAARGTVRVQVEARDLPVRVGMPIAIGTRLETGENGFLTIALPNGSRTTLPTRSALVVRQLRRIPLIDAVDYDLEVAAGKVETEATPINPGKGDLRVRTPRAVSAVRGTRFRVGYAEERSSTEVLVGAVAVGTAGGRRGDAGTQITGGFGAYVATDGTVASEALLPPVALIEPGKVQTEDAVTLALAPVPTAQAYHVQIGADAGFVDMMAEQMVTEPMARFTDIPNGNWFVRATAISATGLEGLYQSYAMKRSLATLEASAQGDLALMRFRWSGAGEGRRAYRFQMAGDDPAALPIVDEGGLGEEGLEMRDLKPGTYHWRVGLRQYSDGEMIEKWLPFEKLIVAPGH